MDILTDDDKRAILNAIADAQALRSEISRAKRAGLDVSQLESELAQLIVKLTALKNVYVSKQSQAS